MAKLEAGKVSSVSSRHDALLNDASRLLKYGLLKRGFWNLALHVVDLSNLNDVIGMECVDLGYAVAGCFSTTCGGFYG
jgi:hypothetical protein